MVKDALAGRDINISVSGIRQRATGYTPGPLHQLRGVPADFVGREQQIAAIVHQILHRPDQGLAPISVIGSVDGMAGVGKTELANVAAHALTPEFPDAQLFVPLGAHSSRPMTSRQAIEFCLTSFHYGLKPPADEAPLRAAYFSAFHGKRCLLVLDDARDDDHITPLLHPPGCAVIVTSRQRLTCSRLAPLDILPRADAVVLLRRLCSRLSAAEADALAGLCGDLPIALGVVGGHLNKKRSEPVDDFTRKLSGPQRLKNLKLGQLDVSAVFEVSHDSLSEEQKAGFHALAVMPASFDRLAALAVIGKTPTFAEAILDELAGRNLVGFDEKSNHFRWHDLLREFSLNQTGRQELDAARTRHAKHFVEVAHESNALFSKGGEHTLRGLALFDRQRAHLEAAISWLDTGDNESVTLLVSLVDAVTETSNLRVHQSRRIIWLEAQCKAARTIGNRQAEATALSNLGIAHAALANTRRAIELHEHALTICREIGDRRGEGVNLSNLGLVYVDLAETRKAIEFHRQALAIAREIGDRRGEGGALANLGRAHYSLGNAATAIEFLQLALEVMRVVDDKRAIGNILDGLGSAYYALWEGFNSLKFHGQALTMAREIGDRRGEATALGNLGLACAPVGSAHRALGFYEQQLLIVREIGDRRGEANALWNSALALDELGERKQAIARAEEALRLRETLEDPTAAKVRAALTEWGGAWTAPTGDTNEQNAKMPASKIGI